MKEYTVYIEYESGDVETYETFDNEEEAEDACEALRAEDEEAAAHGIPIMHCTYFVGESEA